LRHAGADADTGLCSSATPWDETFTNAPIMVKWIHNERPGTKSGVLYERGCCSMKIRKISKRVALTCKCKSSC
jgi:hypothetical protein